MKIAISVPDSLFEAAERMVSDSGTTRSQLYARALEEYLARHEPSAITAAIDRLMDDEPLAVSEFVATAARRRLDAVEW